MGASASKASRDVASKASQRIYPTTSSSATRAQKPIQHAAQTLQTNSQGDKPVSSVEEGKYFCSLFN
jgi:hypothetical protein